jgi:hypothetical protein
MPIIDKMESDVLINFCCTRIPAILRTELFGESHPFKGYHINCLVCKTLACRFKKFLSDLMRGFIFFHEIIKTLSDNPDIDSKAFLISEIFNKYFVCVFLH